MTYTPSRLALTTLIVCGGFSCDLLGAPAQGVSAAIVVRVQSSDAATLSRLQCVRASVRRPEEESPYFQMRRCFRGRGRSLFPGVFAITPESADALRPVSVEVTAELSDGVSYSQLATLGFSRGRTLLAVFDLNARCVGVRCPPGVTCGGGGECSMPIARRDLPDYSPPRADFYVDLDDVSTADAAVAVDADVVADVAVDVTTPADVADVTDVGGDASLDRTDGCTACEEDGRCTDLRSDLEHCGACDRRCSIRDRCSDGACVPVQIAGIAAGALHNCVWMTDGTARCWGNNAVQELGVVTGADRVSRPIRASAFRDVQEMALGPNLSCARIAGRVECVGVVPRGVDRITGASSIAVGAGFVCARLSVGGVRCVGSNLQGSLGDGTTLDRDAPVDVVGLPVRVTQLSATLFNTCVLASGQVACWGLNVHGQLGVAPGATRCGTGLACRMSAAIIPGLADIDSVATAGDMLFGATCAVDRSRAVRCWGQGGLLGAGEPVGVDRPMPGAAIPSLRALDVRFGQDFACALEEGGTVACWGATNVCQTSVASGVGLRVNTPRRVPGLSGVRAIALGSTHACALRMDGEVLCWGNNAQGQLGDGTELSRSCAPVSVRF